MQGAKKISFANMKTTPSFYLSYCPQQLVKVAPLSEIMTDVSFICQELSLLIFADRADRQREEKLVRTALLLTT
jgi:hypothetical protein